MNLVELWQSESPQIAVKRIDQLIAFAGDGQLKDGNATCIELRQLLRGVSSDYLERWVEECLDQRFQDFGFVLQDLVNELGRRLGFEVRDGVYRGTSNDGADGVWKDSDGRVLIVESKTSSTYQINLSKLARYRKQVAPSTAMSESDVSMLIVIGSEDTDDLESQVRGSRYAWSIRLLGVRSLIRLLRIKEQLDSPGVAKQVRDILFPAEFTRLDRIVDLVFQTASDVLDDKEPSSELVAPDTSNATAAPTTANFHAAIIPRLSKALGQPLIKVARVVWATNDEATVVSCQVSKEFRTKITFYWFGLKHTTFDWLNDANTAFCAFGLGSPDRVVMVPFGVLSKELGDLFTSPDSSGGILHWHVRLERQGEKIFLMTQRDRGRVDVSQYLINSGG
jgi:hypothetical protein